MEQIEHLLSKVIHFFIQNDIRILTIGFIIWKRHELYRRMFHDPMTGGNGATQTHEFAQTALVYTFLAFSISLLRGVIIDPQVFLYVCASVVALAGIKLNYDNKHHKSKKDESKKENIDYNEE